MRIASSCLCYLLIAGSMALGQDPRPQRYFPLNTPLPPTGRAGEWATRINRGNPYVFQPVEVQLPVEGQVTWYGSKGPESALTSPAPSMAALLVGPVYRLKLSDMPDYPGVELYPSIEMVDRLHPPAGREAEFPVIVEFTEVELNAAAQGRLVTKVVYLEQPNRASFQLAGRGKPIPALQVPARDNPLEIADLQGRPLAIIRLGGRVPDANRPEPGFFSTGAPIQTVKPAVVPPEAAKVEVSQPAEVVEEPQPVAVPEAVETPEETETTPESEFEE